MRAALILALSLSYAAPALSQTANQAAIREARSYLLPCNQVPQGDRPYCRQNQEEFLDDYLRAKAGNTDYMHDLSNFFGTPAVPSGPGSHPGVRADYRQGCAWLIVEINSNSDVSQRSSLEFNSHSVCAKISPNDAVAINQRAEVLLEELRDNPTTPPPEEPYVPLKGSGPMITTVPDND